MQLRAPSFTINLEMPCPLSLARFPFHFSFGESPRRSIEVWRMG
jgi:hypothetical protein